MDQLNECWERLKDARRKVREAMVEQEDAERAYAIQWESVVREMVDTAKQVTVSAEQKHGG
jgi:hypothetical protein